MLTSSIISIYPPLKGEWRFLRPPGHHPYAFDFVQLDTNRKQTHHEGRFRFLVSKITSNSYYCWNKSVFAPVDGIVMRIGNGWQDHEYNNLWTTITRWYHATFKFRPKQENGRLDIRPNAGNYVMIQAKEGYIVFLAHLRNQSITVTEGAQVHQGDVVGKVGNSGNSTMPHLHINLFDQMDDPFNAKVLPFVFGNFDSLDRSGNWIKNEASLPSTGSNVRFTV